MISETLYKSEYILQVMEQVSATLAEPLKYLRGKPSPQERAFKSLVAFLNGADLPADLHQTALVELGILAEAHLGIFSGQVPTSLTIAVNHGSYLVFKGHFKSLTDQDWRIQLRQRLLPEKAGNVTKKPLLNLEVSPSLIRLDHEERIESPGIMVSCRMSTSARHGIGWGVAIESIVRDVHMNCLGESYLSRAIRIARNDRSSEENYDFNYTAKDTQDDPIVTAKKFHLFNSAVAGMLRS